MFSLEDRQIFGPYFDGHDQKFADPMAVRRKLFHCLDGDPNKFIRATKSESEDERFRSWERIVPAVVVAFDLIPFDPQTGRGAMEEDARRVLRQYLEWIEKKNAGEQSTLTRPPPSVSPSSPCAGCQQQQANDTPSGLPSGSTYPGYAYNPPGM